MNTGSSGRASSRLAIGTHIGDYVIDADLPSLGDNEQVYCATHVLLPRRVRIALRREFGAAAALMREACILEGMRHLGAPRVFDSSSFEGSPWLATELVYGTPVSEPLAHGPLPVLEVLAFVRDVADVLAHAHERHVVHRGVRADTIVRGPQGTMLVDWSNTCSTVLLDCRVDVFALGNVAYKALARDAPTAPLAERCRDAPREVCELIDGMLVALATRPTSAEVRDRAIHLIAALEAAATPTVEVAPRDRRRTRVRWTPAPGTSPLPRSQPIAVGVWSDGYFVLNPCS